MTLPVACSLTEPELQQRRTTLLVKMKAAVIEVKEVEAGYAYRFAGETDISKLAELIRLEHQCCPFLRFNLTVEPGAGPIWLELTGPEGTKEFLQSLFE